MTPPVKPSDPPGCRIAMGGLLLFAGTLTYGALYLAQSTIHPWQWTAGGMAGSLLMAWARWEDRREQGQAEQGKGEAKPPSA
jgi:hypothetical protein